MATRRQKVKTRAPSPKRDKPVRKPQPSGPNADNPRSAVARLNAELREALAQQTATADILRTISQSPTDLQPVLDAVVGAARRFCGAPDALILLREGGETFVAAHDGKLTASVGLRRPLVITGISGRAMIEGRTLQIDDISALDPVADAEPLALARQHKWRASAAAPMMREGEAIGCIVLRKQEPGSLVPHQVQLLETFAAQAVIAIENVRLFTELRQRTDDLTESLEYQTATSELLEVISRSTTDVKPVLDTMLASAARLCGTNSGGVAIRRGAGVSYVASFGQTAEFDQMWRTHEFMPGEATVTGRVLLTRQVVHVADMAEDLDHSLMESVTLGGMRTALGVPLVREGEPIGVIMLNRDRVEPFTDRQIALVKTFADQAVIAMENARLLGELREALDQQTATTEVLQVINSSPGELEPVFEAILEKAMQACHASFGGLWIFDAGRYVAAALHKVPKAYAEFLRTTTLVPGPGSSPYRFLHGERSVIQNVDLAAEELYRAGDPQRRALVDLGGARTAMQVPLCTDDAVIGVVTIYRQEVRAFDDRQIALLQSFAAQAVIAIQNARLLSELRASLEQQTATSDVLCTISRSSVELDAVLETLVQTVARLCRADQAYMFRRHDELHHLVAAHGLSDDALDYVRNHPFEPGRGNTSGRALLERRTVQIADVLADPEYTYSEGQKIAGFRTMLGIPLMAQDNIVGVFVVSRTRVDPFTDKEIALATGFADQAVIAIENARLFEELRDRQAELRVTFDNMGDGVAMFDAEPRLVAWNRNFEEIIGLPTALLAERPSYAGYLRMLAERGEFGTENVEAELASRLENTDRELRLERTRADGTVIEVRRNAVPGGGFVLIYSDVTEQRRAEAEIRAARDTAEAALERQSATSDILKVIASSPTDVQPVLDAVVKAAVRFCGATDAMVQLRDGDSVISCAHEGPLTYSSGARRLLDRSATGSRAIFDAQTCHHADVETLDPVEFFGARRLAAQHGFRAIVAAPLRREDTAIGAVILRKVEAGSYTPQQIALLETFAAQAVIAIENVRLFTELRDSLEQQTATAEILRAISQSPTEVEPVLKAVVGAARRFCGADDAMVVLREETEQLLATHEGSLQSLVGSRFPLDRSSATGRATIDGQTFHVPDVASLDPAEHTMTIELTRRTGVRALLAAPMLREGHAIGCVLLRRPTPGAFTPRQIALLEAFAAQAVIAIENVRLFTELKESLEQQTATADVLQVINSSPGDLVPVFDAMLEKAMRLCAAAFGHLMTFDEQRFAVVAHKGLPPRFADYLRNMDQPGSVGLYASIRAGAAYAQESDLSKGAIYRMSPLRQALVDLGGARTGIVVALRKDDALLGVITIYRQEVRPFAGKEIALLESFAAQAVIAMENARLITEQREALEQQTATAEILAVISQSPTDVGPVLSAVAKAALKFCGASDAQVFLRDGDEWFLAAHEGSIGAHLGRRKLTRQTAPSRAIIDGKVVQIVDLQAVDADEFSEARELGARLGFRSALAAPLLRDDESIGAISLRRREAGEFTLRQIALLETFAAQAVIAIENVRLFTELREALEQQTASAEILQVISQSPTDVAPVLTAVAKAAIRFCNSPDAVIWLRDGDEIMRVAHEGPLPTDIGARRPLSRNSAVSLAVAESRTIHYPDLLALEPVKFADAQKRAKESDYRAALAAPMLREGQAIGAIVLRKQEAVAYTERQIELLEAFAAQAVIAIENVRLFTELRDSLERLKAAQANLIQSEKMASLGQLTAGIAHEIKNPLNFVNNFAILSVDLLDELKEAAGSAFDALDKDKRAEVDETMELLTGNLGKIAEHGKRADGIVKSMLSHSRGGTGDWAPSDINALVDEALNLAYHGARAQDKEFNVTLERDFEKASQPIEVVPQDVTRVFLNLFGNGFYAANKRRLGAKETGFRPTIKVTTREAGDGVEVKVRDNGTGMPPEVREKLFQPFFTTKPTGEGTGLGLSISYDIVTQQHGGTIAVESVPGEFTEFTVRLPRARRVVLAEKVR